MSRYTGRHVATYELLEKEEKMELLNELKIAIEIDEYHEDLEATEAVRDKLKLSDKVRFIKGMKGKESEDEGTVIGLLLDKVMILSGSGQKHNIQYSRIIM